METRASTRRRFRFSLRTLLAAMFVIAICCGFFAIRLRGARRQAHAVAVMNKLGGEVGYDYSYKREGHFLNGTGRYASPLPKWLIYCLGEDFFHNVVLAKRPDGKLAKLGEAQEFWGAIKDLHNIEQFEFSGYNGWMDASAAESLRNHTRLRSLSLNACNLRNQDLEPLSHLKQLEYLHINESQIDDDDAEYLSNFPKLQNLTLGSCRIGNEGLRQIAKNKHLRELRMPHTQVGDDGVGHLKELPELEELGLEWTRITDIGLKRLGECPNLKFVTVTGSQVSKEGVKELSQLFPGAKVRGP